MARMRRNPPAPPAPGTPRPRRAPKVGQLRPSQVITTYGPGSMVDLPNGAVMVACLDTWTRGERIWDLNLENKLGGLAIYKLPTFNPPPSAQADPGTTFGISVIRFPFFGFCPTTGAPCHNRTVPGRTYQRLIRNYRCTFCSTTPRPGVPNAFDPTETIPVRFVAVCENGHITDFPWKAYAGCACNFGDEELFLVTDDSRSGLSGLAVECARCGSTRSLAGGLGNLRFPCPGHRPWLTRLDPANGGWTHYRGGEVEQCTSLLRGQLRSSTSLYFSNCLSALSVPPWVNPIRNAVVPYWYRLREVGMDALLPALEPRYGCSFAPGIYSLLVKTMFSKRLRIFKPSTKHPRPEETISTFASAGRSM